LLETLTAIAGAAGEVVLAQYGRALAVEYKGPRDPVTEADRQANALLVAQLNAAFPGVPVVAEESEPASFASFREAPRVFFVDPLDGTREFIDQNGEFVVMIGLVEEARAIAGVVFAPALGVAWAGAIGEGVWRIDTKTGRRIPVRVSATDALARSRVVASRSHRSPRLERALASLRVGEIQHLGSAGLKGARVAEGQAEAYVETSASTKRWDACAVDALVTAGGGRVSDTGGAPIDYRGASLTNERGLVVSNGLTHEAILARLAR
jgi:3'(2'), 5'-bisphosphate nucleotidase